MPAILSENPIVPTTKAPAHSDKTSPCKLFCRKIPEFPAQNSLPVPTNHLRASCFVGKSQSSQYKTASSFRQTASVPAVLSENLRVPSTKPTAYSDKTPPCDLFCRKIPEFPVQNRQLIPTNRLRASYFVGKSQSSQYKTASSFRQNVPSRSVLSENLRVPSTKPPARSDKRLPRDLFCRKIPEFPVQNRPPIPTNRLRASYFVGKSPSSHHKSASPFRQTAPAQTVLSENLRVPSTKPPAHSDKTPPCQLFCRKITEFPPQNRRLIPTKRLRASYFVGKLQSSHHKTACLFQQKASSRPVLSENPRVPSTKPPAYSDKTPLCQLFCRKISEFPAQKRPPIPTKHPCATCFVGKS